MLPGLAAAPNTSGLLPESLLLLNQMQAAPTLTRAFLMDTLIRALKANGSWDALDVLYVFAAHDEQAARINWKTPGTFTATAVNSPSFTPDRGFTGNGSSAHLTTGLNISTGGSQHYTQNSAHMGVYIGTNVAEGAQDMGLQSSQFAQIVTRNASDQVQVRANANGTNTVSSITSSIGHTCWSRVDSAGYKIFKNGSGSSFTRASETLVNEAVYILRRSGSYSTKQASAAHVGGGLSDAQSAGLHTHLSAFLSAIGAPTA